jgi:hypothetical protein
LPTKVRARRSIRLFGFMSLFYIGWLDKIPSRARFLSNFRNFLARRWRAAAIAPGANFRAAARIALPGSTFFEIGRSASARGPVCDLRAPSAAGLDWWRNAGLGQAFGRKLDEFHRIRMGARGREHDVE